MRRPRPARLPSSRVRVLAVVHHRNAGPGVFAEPALAAGHELVEWLPHADPAPSLDGIAAAIVFGGEPQVDDERRHPWLRPEKALVRQLLERDTPLLGVCLGSQLVAEAAGAVVRRAAQPEIGWLEVELTPEGIEDVVLGFLPKRFESFQWHHYEWLLPPAAVALARSARCLQAFRLEDRPVWGVQFHPEVTHADLRSWLDSWENDPGAVATGLDPEAIRAESAAKVGAWNDVGRGISERFLAAAAERYSAVR
jgi:GMP synthase-like glutamine amidotransferase